MSLTEEDQAYLKDYGYLDIRELPNGVIIGIFRWAFTIALTYNIKLDGDYQYRFCYPYENTADCLGAFKVWDGLGDPPGNWLKNKGYGRDRRNPLIPDPLDEYLKSQGIETEI